MTENTTQILLVEDNPSDAGLLREALEFADERFSLTLASQFSEAQAALAAHPPDVILLDLNLPDSEGLQTLRRMLRLVRNAAIIILTGSDDEQLGIQAVQAGAQDYLAKGQIDARILRRAVHYSVERQRLKASLEAQTVTDELTGLSNRRGFLALARRHFELARRNGSSLALVCVDLDGLRQINETFGYQEGDRALRETAAVLRNSFRTTDVLGRLGGGGFAVLAIDAGHPGSNAVQRRIDIEMRMRNLTPERHYRLSLTVVAYDWSADEKVSLDALLARAEAAVYAQKRVRSESHLSVLLPEISEMRQ